MAYGSGLDWMAGASGFESLHWKCDVVYVCVCQLVCICVCVCVCVSVLSWVFDEKSLHDINISLFFKMAPFPRAAQC